MQHLHSICRICKTQPGICIRDVYTCNFCFSIDFINRFRSRIKQAYRTKNLIIFDGSINSVVLFYMLKTKINPFFSFSFVFISNKKFIYEKIYRENYMYEDIIKYKLYWLEKYNCNHLIKSDSINDRFQNISKSISYLDLISVTEDYKPFVDLLDNEIQRFFDINKESIYDPVSAEVPVFSALDQVREMLRKVSENREPDSLFNLSDDYKEAEEEKK
ncbi:hypothetical protein CDIK_2806 [Cucumispora dikerogammari]|nr:hypothetical protein CDIK_2806 [Cucumispora dikerogammari]